MDPDPNDLLLASSPFDDFNHAVRTVLAHLHGRHGMGLWMFTRTIGNDWLVLHSEDHGYDVANGRVLTWSDSFCSRMVDHGAPQVAHRVADVPLYADAPIGEAMQIGAYLGVPLRTADGELFGTLCAIAPEAVDRSIHAVLPEATLFARLLMTLLETEQQLDEQQRRADAAASEARTDALCAVMNRRGFDDALAQAEARFERYGEPATVVSVDLDGFKSVNDRLGHAEGDELLRHTAKLLADSVRDVDVVARTGGDEFEIILTRTDETSAESFVARIGSALQHARIDASVGAATRGPRRGMEDTLRLADERMYDEKRRRARSREAAVR